MKTLLRIIGIAVLVAAVVEFFRAASLNPHTSNNALAACGILIVLGALILVMVVRIKYYGVPLD